MYIAGMLIKTAKFVISNTDYKKCPNSPNPEYAFIGRSNVGKSSLINMLTNNKKLAKISSNPGKTQLINHFLINDSWYLVDLPGYGYAKVSKVKRGEFGKIMQDYLAKREALTCVFVLLDAQIPPQKIDLEFMEWLGERNVPFVMVFTKTDKLSSSLFGKKLLEYKRKMSERWEFLPQIFQTSAKSQYGKGEILKFIEDTNREVRKNSTSG